MRGWPQAWHGGNWGNQDSGNSSNESGKNKGRCWSRSKSGDKIYYSCGKYEHFIRDLPRKNNKQKKGERRGEHCYSI